MSESVKLRGEMLPRPTLREKQVMELIAQGKTGKEIASELGITYRTVETHRANIFARMRFKSRCHLIHYAIHTGITKNIFSENI